MDEMPAESAEDTAATAERYREMALNPFVPRADVQNALAAFDRLIEMTTPEPDNRADELLLKNSKTRPVAESAKRGLEEGLAQRDVADHAEPRRAELPDRVTTALSVVTDCLDGMQALERAKRDVEIAARNDGFDVTADGCVNVAPEHHGSATVDDHIQTRRALHEHHLMSILGDVTILQRDTVATIRERLGADQPGTPWVLIECARAGIDLDSFETSSGLPASPLRDLMDELAAEMTNAKRHVRSQPPPAT